MKITIPEPCEQKWSEMKSCGLNRFCANCEREIIDFTFYSDAALRRVIEEKEDKICGKFTEKQLNRELIDPPKKQSFFKHISAKWLSFSLLLSSPFEILKAQVPTEQLTTLKTDNNHSIKNIISGIVVDDRNEPVPFAKISLVELKKMTMSDIDGKFKFEIDDSINSTYSLKAWSHGFQDTTVLTMISPNSTELRIELIETKIESLEMIGIIVVKQKFDVFEPKTWIPRQHRRIRNN